MRWPAHDGGEAGQPLGALEEDMALLESGDCCEGCKWCSRKDLAPLLSDLRTHGVHVAWHCDRGRSEREHRRDDEHGEEVTTREGRLSMTRDLAVGALTHA